MKTKHPSLPHHIVRKSRNWFSDTRTGQYIKEANLEAYLARQRYAADPQDAARKDAEIRKARWDLQQD